METNLQSFKSSKREFNSLFGVIAKSFAIILFSFTFWGSHSFAQIAPYSEWTRVYGGDSTDVVSDFIIEEDGGYLLGGYSNSNISGSKSAPLKGGYDYWIIRTNKEGYTLWDKSYGGESDDKLEAIIKTSGGYLLIGTSRSPAGGDKTALAKSENNWDNDIWVVKISTDGSKLWDKSYGGNFNDVIASAIATADGGFMLLGSSNSLISGDKSENPRPGQKTEWIPSGQIIVPASDFWLVKIDATGTKQWDKTYGGSGAMMEYYDSETGTEIVAAHNGGYILSGTSSSGAGYEKTNSSRGAQDYWVVKITDSGVKEWDKTFGGNSEDKLTGGIEVLADGYLIGGNSTSEINGDKTHDNPEHYVENWMIKISKTGEKLWDNILFHGSDEENLETFRATDRGFYLSGETGFWKEPYIEFVSWSDSSSWYRSLQGQELISGYSAAIKIAKNNEVILGVAGYTYNDPENTDRITLHKFTPEIYYGKDSIGIAFYQNYSDCFIYAVKTKNMPNDIVKVEFYVDSAKVAESNTVPSMISWNKQVPGAHYFSIRGVTASGKIVKSIAKVVTIHIPYTYLYRAINLNGPEIKHNDQLIYSSSTNHDSFSYQAKAFANQSVRLIPSTDSTLATVIRSSLYATKSTPAYFTFKDVRKGTYDVYLYVWEDNNAQTFSISINGSIVSNNLNSGTKGSWTKVGPFKTFVNTGKIEIKVEGGDANISAIEVYTLSHFKLCRAINLNGPALIVDNMLYESSRNASDFSYVARAFENQSVPLVYVTDAVKAKMIRSSLYSTKSFPATFTFKNVPSGGYGVYAYVWEDNNPQDINFTLNQEIRSTFNTGKKGEWQKLYIGYAIPSSTGNIEIKVEGGDGNISGIELWNTFYSAKPLTSSKDLDGKSPEVYPNPIRRELYVDHSNSYRGNAVFTIYDIYGKTYLEETNEIDEAESTLLELPLSEMKAGIYFLKVKYNNDTKIIRLNKE